MNPDYAEKERPFGQSGQREVGKGGGQQVALFCVGNARRIRELMQGRQDLISGIE